MTVPRLLTDRVALLAPADGAPDPHGVTTYSYSVVATDVPALVYPQSSVESTNTRDTVLTVSNALVLTDLAITARWRVDHAGVLMEVGDNPFPWLYRGRRIVQVLLRVIEDV